MSSEVLITGLGIVSPIGIGVEHVWRSIKACQSGIQGIDFLAQAGWPSPFGGVVQDFEPKAYVQPRKSLKVMSRETQLAFAAGELAWADAGLEEFEVASDRLGVIGAADMQYSPVEEMTEPMAEGLTDQGTFDLVAWGHRGMRQLYPLWMLKYLPNMPACHIGIRRQAFGPTNTISLGTVSSLVALSEATATIRRGAADMMIVGGASSTVDFNHLTGHGGGGLSQRDADPETISRPFDKDRDGSVAAEGAAYFVIESREHAERRGYFHRNGQPWATVGPIVSRYEPSAATQKPTGKALAQAAETALASGQVEPASLAMVKAHGASRVDDDSNEAQAVQQVVADAPVTAPTSFSVLSVPQGELSSWQPRSLPGAKGLCLLRSTTRLPTQLVP